MVPPHLLAIQRKHIEEAADYKRKAARNARLARDIKQASMAHILRLQHSFADTCSSTTSTESSDTVCAAKRCCICYESRGILIAVRHQSERTCEAMLHEECLEKWRRQHERHNMRIRRCPVCKQPRDCEQPKKRARSVCGTVLGVGHCRLLNGHLGPCALCE